MVLDANGEANVWLDPTLAYKFILKDSSDVTQWTIDQVTIGGFTGAPGWNSSSTYDEGSIVSDASGAGLFYVSLSDNNVGNALSNVTYWRAFGGALRTVTSNTSLAVTDELVRSNSTSGALTHTLPACGSTPIGKRITVKDVGTGGYTTSVKGAGSDNVDGANTYSTALSRYDSVTVENNGSSWDVVDGVVPDARVSSAKLATDLNLPGNSVQENGKKLVVSNTNASTSLSIIRGTVDASGGITYGEGFTVNKTGTGIYEITFATSFAAAPVVVASCTTQDTTITTSSPAVGGVNFRVRNLSSADNNGGFNFVAIGTR